jgi:molybdopterin-guanine dinucleotide biosynthesis protein
MALIMVGGQAKNVGKTTLICNIIATFRGVRWTAVKISNHGHVPQDCEVVKEGAEWTIWRQNPTNDHSDTALFLRSGADRSLLVQTDNRSLREACASLGQEFSAAPVVIVESASAAEFLDYDLLLILLDAVQDDFKESTRQQLDCADAFLLRNSDLQSKERIDRVNQKPVFAAFRNSLDRGLVSMLAATLGTYA